LEEAIKLRQKIFSLLDERKYDEALSELDNLRKSFIENGIGDLFLLTEIGGSYITLGDEANNLEAVKQGLLILEKNRELIKTAVTEESLDYTIGNGYLAINKISEQQRDDFFPTPEIVKNTLFKGKQCYLKVFKKIDVENLDDFSMQVLINLGNNLNRSGRIVEALQLFDLVLKYNSEISQGVVSKADALVYLVNNSDCEITTSLFSEIYRLYKKGTETKIAPLNVKQWVEEGLAYSKNFLIHAEFDFDAMEEEFLLNQKEYERHSHRIRFFLDNFLSLSEHGLYCKCNGAKVDNLAIGYDGFITTDKKIMQLELLNNRLKSEFSLARQLYYDFLFTETIDHFHYQNVVEGMENGIKYEKLRTSFRLCFGILDKIAEGICHLLDLEIKEKESIYFESFWSSTQVKSRWKKINSFKNLHLTALYGIACDLNKKEGEFGFYKRWRNKLEHGLFSLTTSDYVEEKWLNKQFSENTFLDDFENKTKHLLQFTRAAIFSFVFCARQELVTEKTDGSS
jgi:tetratricopeptide (TPR) repeat protein